MYVSVSAGIKKFLIVMINGSYGFVGDLCCSEYKLLYRPVWKDVKLDNNERYLRGSRHDVGC